MTELPELVRRVAGWAGETEQVEVYAERSRRTSIRVHEGEVESFTSAEPAGAGIRVVQGSRVGFASAGSLDETVLKETLEEARDNARFAEPDEHAGLPVPDGVEPAEVDLFRDWVLPVEERITRTIELERIARGKDRRITGFRIVAWEDVANEQAIATSMGIEAGSRSSYCWVYLSSLAEADGQTQTGTGLSLGRAPDELDMDAAAAEAVVEAVRMLGARKPASALTTAVLMPQVTAQVLHVVGAMLSGDALVKGRTPFAGRIGEEIAPERVTILDDPAEPAATGADPYDREGLASRRTALVENGTLRRFVHDTYSARRAGGTSTASAAGSWPATPVASVRAVTFVPGEMGAEEILRLVGDGVLIQSVTGMHSGVNPVSGDFSAGAAGLMIRDGDLAEPVQEMTIASTLQRMLLDVVAVGSDVRWLGGPAAGLTLAVRDVALSGT